MGGSAVCTSAGRKRFSETVTFAAFSLDWLTGDRDALRK